MLINFEMKKLNKDDVWALIIRVAALATGGDASAPTYEEFSKSADPILNQGYDKRLLDPKDLTTT
jgi:hypothetical protein